MKTLLPDDPHLLAEFAAILAIVNGGNLNGKPMEILRIALELDPNHRRTLELCAIAAFNERDYAAAIGYWKRLQNTFPPGSENARKVAARIDDTCAAALANPSAAVPPVRPH